MEQEPLGEQVICWACDCGLFFLAVLLLVAWWRWQNVSALLVEPMAMPTFTMLPIAQPAPATLTYICIRQIAPTTTPTSLPSETPTSTPPSLPEYVLVFTPVDWQADKVQFERLALIQADTLIKASWLLAEVDIHQLWGPVVAICLAGVWMGGVLWGARQ